MHASYGTSRRRLVVCAWAVVALPLLGGCAAPWGAGKLSGATDPFTVSPLPSEPPAATAQSADTSPHTQEQALADVFDELQQIGDIDPLARERLTNDLRSVKPEHWPLMVTQFKSALAYREQLARREGEPLDAKTQDMHEASAVAVVSDERTLEDAAMPLPPPPAPERVTPGAAVQTVSHTSVSPLPKETTWNGDLEAAIAKLECEASVSPGSTDDIHQQMRLRMLYLMAGRQSDAMLPIPGVGPAQQDYWSNQLFALSAYFDNARQPDDKGRAAASLIHLDQARAKLSELATLELRNLTFVDSVDGFGVYKRREDKRFRPGDQVTLYAEVENFRSESTKDGYRTSLGTSYEVVDASDQRVDSRQFPDIVDVCQNQRRDFHMQYGVVLPTRIYPGQYQLRLTITDQLSHKIGQASVPFEIIE